MNTNAVWVVIIMTLFFLGFGSLHHQQSEAKESKAKSTESAKSAEPERQNPTDILPELRLFGKALSAIMQGYVDDVSPREMFYNAIKGMASSLDKYSQFFDRKKFEALEIHLHGEYAGIGAKLAPLDSFPAIYFLQPDSPAAQAGLQVKDKITRIDDQYTEGMEIEDVAALLRGDEGSSVKLGIQRDITKQAFEVTLKRKKIEIPAVTDVKMIGKAIGYLHITNWQDHTVEQFDQAIKDLQKKGMKALIIDVRDNGGGLMPSAVTLATHFLPEDSKIVSVKSKVKEQQKEYISTGEHKLVTIPLTVLVNELSASASEIFSASMQDNKRATIIGVKSFGKASVQSVIPLDDVTGMKITTARYLTPLGRKIDGTGIQPDILVEKTQDDAQLAKAVELLAEYK